MNCPPCGPERMFISPHICVPDKFGLGFFGKTLLQPALDEMALLPSMHNRFN